MNVDAGISRQFKNGNNQSLTISAGPSFNLNKTPVLFNNERSQLTTAGAGFNAGFQLNYKDLVEFNPKYILNINRSHYTDARFTNRDITGNVVTGELILRIPKKIVWETNLFYRVLNEVAPGLPTASIYWNAAVTLLMFNQDKGQLRFAVYDILNSNTTVNRYFSGNSIIDTRYNVLQRYFMLTYTYNIRTFGNQKAKVGGRQSLFNF